MSVIELFPNKKGEWHFRLKGGKGKDQGPYQSRREAFRDALVARVDEAIVLLRLDGSVYGELYHARGNSNPPQEVDILAAQTVEKGVSFGG